MANKDQKPPSWAPSSTPKPLAVLEAEHEAEQAWRVSLEAMRQSAAAHRIYFHANEYWSHLPIKRGIAWAAARRKAREDVYRLSKKAKDLKTESVLLREIAEEATAKARALAELAAEGFRTVSSPGLWNGLSPGTFAPEWLAAVELQKKTSEAAAEAEAERPEQIRVLADLQSVRMAATLLDHATKQFKQAMLDLENAEKASKEAKAALKEYL
tara:strand:+ start:998 stop:1636 length:639 start_codon:yes stop_codon:yes gene_type:complete